MFKFQDMQVKLICQILPDGLFLLRCYKMTANPPKIGVILAEVLLLIEIIQTTQMMPSIDKD
jgi:hypothetical protein